MQTDISTEAQVNAQLALQDLNQRTRLWRLAEGRFGWPIFVAGLLPVLLVIIGLVIRFLESGFAGIMGKDPSSYYIVLGIALFTLMLWSNTQRQIGAMRILLKDLERRRP
jgi:hypothetical protein